MPWRHENFFLRVIAIVDFKNVLRIQKNFAFLPVGANSSIFGTFAWTYLITLKLYQNKEDIILNKNHEKKFSIFLVILPKWLFKISKIGKISKFTKISKVSQRHELFSWGNFHRMNRIWPRDLQKFCNLTRERQFVNLWLFCVDSSDDSQTLSNWEGHYSG